MDASVCNILTVSADRIDATSQQSASTIPISREVDSESIPDSGYGDEGNIESFGTSRLSSSDKLPPKTAQKDLILEKDGDGAMSALVEAGKKIKLEHAEDLRRAATLELAQRNALSSHHEAMRKQLLDYSEKATSEQTEQVSCQSTSTLNL